MLFLRAEGDADITLGIKYDWGLTDRTINPNDYDLVSEASIGSVYGLAIYGTDTYSSSTTTPLIVSNIQGSGRSFNLTFVNTSTDPCWTVMGQVIKYKTHGYS